jgi:hypothetical protein
VTDKNFVVYDEIGRILRSGSCPEKMLDLQARPGETVLAATGNDRMQYVLNNVVWDRPINPAILDKTEIIADGKDIATLVNVPEYSLFKAVNTETFESISGPMADTDTFKTTIPGAYKLSIYCWPFLDWEADVNAL